MQLLHTTVLSLSGFLELFTGAMLMFNTRSFISKLYPNMVNQINPLVLKYGVTAGSGLFCIGILSLMPFVDEACTSTVFKVITLYNVAATVNNFMNAGMAPPTVIHGVLLAGCVAGTSMTL